MIEEGRGYRDRRRVRAWSFGRSSGGSCVAASRQNRSVVQRQSITYIRNTAALLRSPCLLPGGWRPHLLLLADFNLVSGHVRAPAPIDRYTTTYGVGASPIWFGLTGFSSDRGLIKGCVPSGRGANRRRSCSVQGVGARAAAAITADDLVIVFYSVVPGSLFPSTLLRQSCSSFGIRSLRA